MSRLRVTEMNETSTLPGASAEDDLFLDPSGTGVARRHLDRGSRRRFHRPLALSAGCGQVGFRQGRLQAHPAPFAPLLAALPAPGARDPLPPTRTSHTLAHPTH